MARTGMEVPRGHHYLGSMDSETRAAIATLTDTVVAGFSRVDHYFELQQLQFVEFRAEMRGEMTELRAELRGEMTELRTELRGEIAELRDRVDALTDRVGRLEHEVLLLRDYVTREFAEVRAELRDLRNTALNAGDDLRRDIAALTLRVDRLEERQSD